MTKATRVPGQYMYNLILSIVILLFASPLAFADEAADENEALRQRIEYLEVELEKAREKLAESEPQAASYEPAEPKKSPIRIGGAMRSNHVYGDYSGRRGENIGNSEFELLRLNVDLDYGNVIGRTEYRYYDKYSMMHTAWLGYRSDDYGTLKAGIVRVPYIRSRGDNVSGANGRDPRKRPPLGRHPVLLVVHDRRQHHIAFLPTADGLPARQSALGREGR